MKLKLGQEEFAVSEEEDLVLGLQPVELRKGENGCPAPYKT